MEAAMQRWFAVSACIALTACGGSSRGAPSVEAPSISREGQYEFSATTPNQVIRGTIHASSDAMNVQFETPCQSDATTQGMPSGMPSSTSVSRYYCSGAWLTFDRRNPSSAKWFASVQLPRAREVCARYETQSGRQVCVSRNTETYYINETRAGVIQVRRTPAE
jgi:hypothetical protein